MCYKIKCVALEPYPSLSETMKISQKAHDILCNLLIGDWQSKPHQQQQPHKPQCQDVKPLAISLFNRTDAPVSVCLLALMYVYFVLNITASISIHNALSLQAISGVKEYIRSLL